MAALGAEMHGQRRLVELARNAAVEIGVLRGGDLGPGLGPERGAVGDLGRLGARLLDDGDRHRHVAGLRLDDALELEALGVGLGVLHQMKDDARAARRRLFERGRRHRERALAVGRPQPGFVAAGAAGDNVDPVGDHEGRVEADAELPDQGGAFAALRRFDLLHEGPGAGARDGAERLDHLVAAHADAVVLDRQLPLVGIDRDGDAQLRVVAEQGRIGDRLVAQPLAGIGRVRNQLAEEDVFVGIDRVHHHVQQLGDIGLERAAFGSRVLGIGHGRQIPVALNG